MNLIINFTEKRGSGNKIDLIIPNLLFTICHLPIIYHLIIESFSENG